MKGNKNVYEILLPSGNYIYACYIEKFSFGIFNYKSKNKINNVDDLLNYGIITHKSSKETAINKKIWKKIGNIDLEKEGIQWPDLANYCWWDIEGSIERSNITRNGSLLKVDKEYFLELVDKGYIDGFFDKYETFENWLDTNFGKYPPASARL